jgi:glycosyltransferase involved in cell wall biosynthesis
MDMLPATVRALDLCAGEFEFTLDVYGPVDAVSEPFLKRPYVRHRGKVSNETVRESLADYHALVFTQLCAPCPNTVIEAVAAGLPVIAYDSGAIRELTPFNQSLIAGTRTALFHELADFDPARLADCIRIMNSRRSEFMDAALLHREDFAEAKTLARYAGSLPDPH